MSDLAPTIAEMGTGFGGGDLQSSLLGEYSLLVERVALQREQADRLRTLAEQVEEQVARDEHLLGEMRAALGLSAQLRIDDLSPRLRGQRLQEIAVEVLRAQWEPGREIHYRAWYDLVTADGHKVGGKDPLATFLAQIHRAPGVDSVGRRSGKYRLNAGAADARRLAT